jgi:hypothetical protein
MANNLEKLKHEIESLPQDKQEEIFFVLHRTNSFYSQNQNGIFINLVIMKEEAKKEIIGIIEQYKNSVQDNVFNTHEKKNGVADNTISVAQDEIIDVPSEGSLGTNMISEETIGFLNEFYTTMTSIRGKASKRNHKNKFNSAVKRYSKQVISNQLIDDDMKMNAGNLTEDVFV